MKSPLRKPVVQLIGQDGNAFAIMGRVRNALKQAGGDHEYIEQYISQAMSGDYNNLLVVSMKYVDVR